MEQTLEFTESDLVSRLTNFEDHFVERKTVSDQKDWGKTVVAFANSAPNRYPCVLFIGARDNGEIETPQRDLDSVQKTLNSKLKLVYPPPPYLLKVIVADGRQVLAVIVFGSELRPHFSGPAYIRKGSESYEASEEQHNLLIATRNNKASKIMEYMDKVVTVINRPMQPGMSESSWGGGVKVYSCNQYWVTLISGGQKSSFPLSRVELNFDDTNNTLKLELMR